MTAEILIGSETSAEVTVAAPKTLPISNHREQFIIAALRVPKALTISLLAELAGMSWPCIPSGSGVFARGGEDI